MAVKPTPIRRVNKRARPPLLRRAGTFIGRYGKAAMVTAAIPAAIIGVYAGYRELMTTPYLALTEIAVTGAKRLSKEEVIEESGIELGQNILSYSVSDVVDGLKQDPWIAQAWIARTGLDSVRIEIKEREPLALVRFERPGTPDRLRIMDSTGVVFTEYTHEDALDLPVITGVSDTGWAEHNGGWSAPAVMGIIQFLKERKGFNINDVSEIRVDGVFGLTIYTLKDGVRLSVGTDGFKEQFEAFDRIVASRGGTLNGIEAMNLIKPGEVVVRFTTNMI